MPVLFTVDVLPLFRSVDIFCMARHQVFLDDYDYMADPAGDGSYSDYANARHVFARLSGAETPQMPRDGSYWSQQQLDIFQAWMTGGFLK